MKPENKANNAEDRIGTKSPGDIIELLDQTAFEAKSASRNFRYMSQFELDCFVICNTKSLRQILLSLLLFLWCLF